jgi:autotransporter-associated beta strand protein
VQTSGTGAIILTATIDLVLLAPLANADGPITLVAANNLNASSSGNITTESGAIRIAPGGTLTFDANIALGLGSVTFAIVDAASQMRGVISGAGDVIKQGSGTLTLTAGHTYTGATDVLAGVLRVDGVIGALSPAQRLTLAGGTTLTGGGDINAPVFSSATTAVIVPTGNLRLGDGSAAGFNFAGQLFVGSGQLVTLRDANLAQLGILTSITGGGKLLAANGVEVGSGETLTGSGAVGGNVQVLAGGIVSPGSSSGVLATDVGDVNLFPNATFLVQVTGTSPGSQYDQLNVQGSVSVEGSILSLQGGLFRPANGVVFTLIVNDGTDPISGRFREASGQTLNEGSVVTFGGIVAALSYVGGAGGNDVTLTVRDRITIVQTNSTDTSLPAIGAGRAQIQETNFLLARSIAVAPPIVIDPPPPPVNSAQTEVRAANQELRQTDRIRVFFRIVNSATDEDEPKQYELDPNVLRDVLGFFKRYKFQDNHYRIYLQEPGKKERLILDVHIVDGRIVPPNFRETENQGAPAPNKPATEQTPPPPPKTDAAPVTNSNMEQPGAAANQNAEPEIDQDQKAATDTDASWHSRLRAALASDSLPLDKVARLVRKAR